MTLVFSIEQCQYLADKARDLQTGQAVSAQDDKTMSIFVEREDTLGEDGSGVWVDSDGDEQHGP